MARLTLQDAIRQALRDEMRRDDRVVVLGGDVRTSMSGLTAGLVDEFGPRRLLNLPIAEAAMTGLATGAALAGLVPVVDVGDLGFSLSAIDQVTNQGPKFYYAFNGQLAVPVVFLFQYAARGWGAQHDQAIYALLGHLPGLKLVVPSSPADAMGLTRAAIRDPGPVAMCVAQELFSKIGEVADQAAEIDFGSAAILRPGDDVSLYTSGALVAGALEAAERAAAAGVSVEVIDLRSLVPLDWGMLTTSVRRTGRAIVHDHGHVTCGFAATIAAGIQERAFDALKGPVLSVTTLDVPMPYSFALANQILPTTDRVVAAIERSMEPGARTQLP